MRECGGRISRMKNKRNENVGPLRVYVGKTWIPGLVVSWSFGDLIAHQIGVLCEPEIKRIQIPNDPY